MLEIFILVPTALPLHLLISPSINQEKSVATSNNDGFTLSPLLQQMNGTRVLDEDIDLELSDDELELIAGNPQPSPTPTTLPQCVTNDTKTVCSVDSDVFVGGKKIINFRDFPYNDNQKKQIDFIVTAFAAQPHKITISRQTAGIISNHLRDTAPILTKRAHCGFTIDLPSNPDIPVDVRFIGCP